MQLRSPQINGFAFAPVFARLRGDIRYRVVIIRPWAIWWCTAASNSLFFFWTCLLHVCVCVCMGVSHMASNPSRKSHPRGATGGTLQHSTLCGAPYILLLLLFLTLYSSIFSHSPSQECLALFAQKIFWAWRGETGMMRWIWDKESSVVDPVVVTHIQLKNDCYSISGTNFE